MLPRMLAGSLLLSAFTLIGSLIPFQAAQTPEKPSTTPKWEYKAVKLEAKQCLYEDQVTTALNTAGTEGWELVSYERLPVAFASDAQGALLIRPAATGPGRDNTPPTADSFQGTITMKMPQIQPGPCRLLLKRIAPMAAHK